MVEICILPIHQYTAFISIMLSIYFIFPIKSFYQKSCSGIFLLRLQLGGVTVEKLFHTKCLLSICSYLSQQNFFPVRPVVEKSTLCHVDFESRSRFLRKPLPHRLSFLVSSQAHGHWSAHIGKLISIWSALSSPAHKHIGELTGELCFQERRMRG